MKKRILVSLAALACLAMLGGCKFLSRTNIDFDADSISKAQQIVVQDAAGNEKSVLKGEEEIDAFNENPGSVEINAIVGKICTEMVRLSREKSVAETNAASEIDVFAMTDSTKLEADDGEVDVF